MRPYLSFHDRSALAVHYLIHPPRGPGPRLKPELIGGTIAWRGTVVTRKEVASLPKPDGYKRAIITMALSLPKGRHLGRGAWHEVVEMALNGLSLPAREIPWLAFRHRDASCDHVHVLFIAMSFTGRTYTLGVLDRICEATHVRLCHHLGIDPPPYPDLTGRPRMQIFVPERRVTSPARRVIAEAITAALRHGQPDSTAAMTEALKIYGPDVTIRREPTFGSAWLFTHGETEVAGHELSRELVPAQISARFDAARQLRVVRRRIEEIRLSQILLPLGPDLDFATLPFPYQDL